MESYVLDICNRAKATQKNLKKLTADTKNSILLKLADDLEKNSELIIKENQKDLQNGKAKGLSEAMLGNRKHR